MPRGRILLIWSEAAEADAFRAMLKPLPVQVEAVPGWRAALDILTLRRFHAIIAHMGVPTEKDGKDGLLSLLKDRERKIPMIVLVEQSAAGLADGLHAAGAFDVMMMPTDRDTFAAVVRRALLRSGLMFPPETVSSVPNRPARQFPFLVGTSEPMQDILRRIAKAAEADANVCIIGETGTGKELVARAIHYSSRRASRPMMVFDCTAVPEGLMESEMFGHVKGSFTSAVADRDGMFQLANGGSLLLDEIGELALPLQAKLLRVLQYREFRKVGGKEPMKVDLRIIAATNRNLAEMAAAGTFREDLFYRLDVLSIRVPPLRERKEDIPLLVDYFIEKFNRHSQKQIHGVHPKTMGALLRHPWPGNIRQLENCIERAAVMADGPILTIEDPNHIPEPARVTKNDSADSDDPSWPLNLKEAEKMLMLRALRRVNGDKTRAADLLGISLRALYYKLKELDAAEIPMARRMAAGQTDFSPTPSSR
jgi:two-component system, NtrC family, response regulator AtoC